MPESRSIRDRHHPVFHPIIGSLNIREYSSYRALAGFLAGLAYIAVAASAQDRIEFKPLPPLPSSPLAAEKPFQPGPVADLLEAQIALCRRNISSGSIDGVYGAQTQAALKAFQQANYLRVHGELDYATRQKLILTRPALTTITVQEEDLAALHPIPGT